MISLSQLWLGLFFFTLQCLSFSSPVLRFLFFFCLVKLLFPDSYWAGRTGKALSLKHSASWGWAHHARTTACSVTTALFQEQAPSLQEGPERHRLLASSAPLRVQKQGAVWEWFEKSETNTSTCCAVLALLGPKSSHSPTFLSSDCPGRALAHGCIRHFGKVTQPRPFPLGSCLRWCYTSAASTGKCALIAGPSPTLCLCHPPDFSWKDTKGPRGLRQEASRHRPASIYERCHPSHLGDNTCIAPCLRAQETSKDFHPSSEVCQKQSKIVTKKVSLQNVPAVPSSCVQVTAAEVW